MKQYGPSARFWETQQDNVVLSRLDLAVAQMLELNVIRCVDVTSDTGVEYAWTYLGQQCCHRLGAVAPVLPFPVISGDIPESLF